jgi:hypothetical protein
MIGAAKDWASALGFDRDSDEKTMAARARVLARALVYLDDLFPDADGERPPEHAVIELGQFLVLAEGMESKGRASKLKELYETIMKLYLAWDEIDRDEAFKAIAEKIAVFKGIIAFSDAWLGTVTLPPGNMAAPGSEPSFDAADVKTRIVRRSDLGA